MIYSTDSLEAFVAAAQQGSFSAAARQLRKTQSTISTAIANLEIDLGNTLFDRSGRYPLLTPFGKEILGYAQEILDAQERLARASTRLSSTVETRLTIASSDVFQLDPKRRLLHNFAARFPDISLEWLDAEGQAVIDYVKEGRAQLGLLSRNDHYPDDIQMESLGHYSELSIYVAKEHPLAQKSQEGRTQLARYRKLQVSTQLNDEVRGPLWSASDYLMVLEMAEDGLGWAELPKILVERYGRRRLVELQVPGWPRRVNSDAVWLRGNRLGPAALWWLKVFQYPQLKDPEWH